jgi:ABC-2 type transport system ATP-binding protein
MDPLSARQVRDAITDLRKDGRTIILCTHNLPEAEELADRIAIIRRGSIVAQGTPQELKLRLLGLPLMEIRLAQEVNGIAKDIASLVEIESSGDTWIRYRTEDPATINPKVIQKLTSKKQQVITLTEITRSLEEVYLHVVDDDGSGKF